MNYSSQNITPYNLIYEVQNQAIYPGSSACKPVNNESNSSGVWTRLMDDAHNPAGASRDIITVLHYQFENDQSSAETGILQNGSSLLVAFLGRGELHNT